MSVSALCIRTLNCPHTLCKASQACECIEVWTLTQPLKDINIVVLKPFLCSVGFMFEVTVVLGNQSSPRLQQLPDLYVFYRHPNVSVSTERLWFALFLPDWFLTLQPCDSWDTTKLCLVDIFTLDTDLDSKHHRDKWCTTSFRVLKTSKDTLSFLKFGQKNDALGWTFAMGHC